MVTMLPLGFDINVFTSVAAPMISTASGKLVSNHRVTCSFVWRELRESYGKNAVRVKEPSYAD